MEQLPTAFSTLLDDKRTINAVPDFQVYVTHEVKYTIKKLIQLDTTPIAQYELVNISGRNSYFAPNASWWNSEQYAMSGIATAMYTKEKRSSKNTLGLEELHQSSAYSMFQSKCMNKTYAGAS